MTTVSNGIRVCSESFNSPFAKVGVLINAGSRNENLETSGAAYMRERLAVHNTSSSTGKALEDMIKGSGRLYDSGTKREVSYHTMKAFPGDLSRAVNLLGDLVSTTPANEAAFELERERVRDVHENNHTEYESTTLENVHFNAFRDHMMGQPRRGDRDNLGSLSAEDVHNFHSDNFYGDNMIVVGTGDHDHNQLVDLVEQHFANVPKTVAAPRANADRPIYTPALLFVRDDEMVNANVGVFYDAPGRKHEDYYGFQLLKRIFGDYDIQKNSEHLNDCYKQYNNMHTILGELPDVTRQRCHHLAFSDAGLFGNYFFGNEIFVRQMAFAGLHLPTIYGDYLNQVEVYRGRNKLFNELLDNTGVDGTMADIAMQVLYNGRRVPRSEIAK